MFAADDVKVFEERNFYGKGFTRKLSVRGEV
jgi:hypothetical protein